MKAKRIAIYSGEIPSTTFVERLIEGLAQNDYEIFLSGALKKVPDYGVKNIKIIERKVKASKIAQMYQCFFSKAFGNKAIEYDLSQDEIVVADNKQELNEFSNECLEQNNSAFRILSIGRADWTKGYSYALDACKILKDKGVDFEYTIIGGSNYEELTYQKSDLGLEDLVKLEKNRPLSQVEESIKCADLLLLPNVKEDIVDGVLEAMTLGTLVLISDCGSMTEIVKDGHNGFIFLNRNSEAIATKIIEIMRLPKEEKYKILLEARKDI